MTVGRLARLQQLHADATPAPWYSVVNDLVGGLSICTVNKRMSMMRTEDFAAGAVVADLTFGEDNPALIVEARNALPALLQVAHAAAQVADQAGRALGAYPYLATDWRIGTLITDAAALREALAALDGDSRAASGPSGGSGD